MADSPRARKIAERIQVVVAETIDRRIKDPRLGFVTITDVRVTGDLQHASIFYTAYGTEDEKKASAAALESAKGLLRSEVGKSVGIRLTPTLEFIVDAVPENAAHIESALERARAQDERVARLAQEASHAGEADPYRHDDEADEERD